MFAKFTNYGATIVSLNLPDKNEMVRAWVQNGAHWTQEVDWYLAKEYPVLEPQYLEDHGLTEEDPLRLEQVDLSEQQFRTFGDMLKKMNEIRTPGSLSVSF